MSALGNILAILFVTISATASLITPAHAERQTPIETASLDYWQPFGFNWRSYDGGGQQIDIGHLESCRALIGKLDALIKPRQVEHFVTLCTEESYTTIFTPSDRLPPAFQQGELSVLYRGEFEPVSYNYSFLHRVLPNDAIANTAQRKKHASTIREHLNTLYGLPVAHGYYDQGSHTGFVADENQDGPCAVWQKDNVAILLCSERVVLIDGIEMALSFARLDRAPNGRSLQCMIDPMSRDDCESATKPVSNDLPASKIRFLETLAKWVGPDSFRMCATDSLAPLETRLALSEADKASLTPVLETHAGDDLALYGVNYRDVAGNHAPRDTQEKIILFLLNQAASQGSAMAMNEIGASLLYCFFGVQQDTSAAQAWLEKAAAGGDAYAMKSLALMHLAGLTNTENPHEDAMRLLEQCAVAEEQTCSKELAALKKLLSLSE